MIGLDLKAFLTAQLGTNTKGVHPITLPQKAQLPAITYKRVSTPRYPSHSGTSYSTPRYQLDAWGETYLQAITLANVLTNTLHGYTGSFGTVNAQAVFVENELDVFDPDSKLFHIAVDVIIWYNE